MTGSGRPWPAPAGPWVMAQTWLDLLFAHWRLPAEAVRRHVPAALPIDTYDGSAWLSVTPFEIRGARVRGLPPLPRFPELNVRTYVTLDGKPGIWFFSLDAGSAVAVAGARLTYRLPYFHAVMAIERRAGAVRYDSERRRGRRAALAADYAPTGPARPAPSGTLEHFLAERYCLYAVSRRGAVLRAEIDHAPWPLQPAAASLRENTMPPPGLELPARAPALVHFAHRQDVVIWPPRVVRARSG